MFQWTLGRFEFTQNNFLMRLAKNIRVEEGYLNIVPFTKIEGNTPEHLGQLFVTPEMRAKKINKIKDNKPPGVDGILPNLLKKIVEQISTQLAKCLTCH